MTAMIIPSTVPGGSRGHPEDEDISHEPEARNGAQADAAEPGPDHDAQQQQREFNP
jgi:hypothetical protein